ncbi:hypothetical protein PV773_12420 [Mesorhizobium sp. CC13]|uniref:hypothetical protein n=1 Tax=Mesorhizobium sp. CC13 TaxID=3029194 RepID=UPI0032647050
MAKQSVSHLAVVRLPSRRLSCRLPSPIWRGPASGLLPQDTRLDRLRPHGQARAVHGRTLAENSGHLRSGDVSDRARPGAAMRSGAELAERASDWKPFSAGRGPEGTAWNCAQSVAAIRNGAVAHLGGVKEMHGHAGL